MIFKRKNKIGPREVEAYVGRLLAGEWGKVPPRSDHWVKFMEVKRHRLDDKNVVDIRIFDESEANEKHVKVRDYSSLDQYPDLVLFEGWYNRKNKTSQIKLKKAA